MEPPWVAYYNFKVEGFVVETVAWLEESFFNPRLRYVAFCRAERFLCIAYLESIKDTTISNLSSLGVQIS